ncbi:hypothetical protein L0F63_002171 [Massospora cicadina]|nr:hypothetical protein L0F63_002171 [Massospora cicadina]
MDATEAPVTITEVPNMDAPTGTQQPMEQEAPAQTSTSSPAQPNSCHCLHPP